MPMPLYALFPGVKITCIFNFIPKITNRSFYFVITISIAWTFAAHSIFCMEMQSSRMPANHAAQANKKRFEIQKKTLKINKHN